MKKNFIHSLFVLSVIVAVLFSGAQAVSANASSMTVSQFVELLITVGAIAPDKVAAARAFATNPVSFTADTAVSTSTSYIQVFKPNGGESWEIDLDVPYVISWGSSGLTQARVALVNAKNVVCELNQAPVSSKDGDHTYNILVKKAQCYNQITGTSTPLEAGSYRARVYYKSPAGVMIKDDSNAVFKIVPKPILSLKLTYPNGGEQLVRNREYSVKYVLKNEDDSNDGLIYYYLLDNNGNNALNGHKALRGGAFDLDLPSSLSAGAYKLKLKLTTDDDRIVLEDSSDNFFWVSTGL